MITIGIGFILLSTLFRLWLKHRQGLPLSRLEKAVLISELVTGFLWTIYILVQIVGWLPPSGGWQIMIPPEVNWGIFVTLTIVVIIIVIVRLGQRYSIKHIECVHAYVFFPVGTLEENKNLDYHGKHFHKKLIVNFKTKIPQAYYLTAADTSYGWKLIHKFPDMWTAMEDLLYPNPDTQKWCEEKGYKLNPWSASKEELLKTDVLVEPKENIEKIEEKPTVTEKLTKPYDEEQLHYRSQLKDEINRIRLELENVRNPKEILFPVWLCNHDPEQKRKLIGNNKEYEIIQKFYTSLQDRNNYLKSMNRPDAQFVRLNTKCIADYNTITKVVWLKEEPNLRQTGKEVLQALYFFLEHWATYKRLMEGDSWRLESPQKGEIKWCSDQLKFAVIKARTLNLGRISAIIDQIEAVSDDMAELGMNVLQQFPVPFSAYESERDEIQRLIARGDAICKKLKEVIPKVEQSFMKEGDIEDISDILDTIPKRGKIDDTCVND